MKTDMYYSLIDHARTILAVYARFPDARLLGEVTEGQPLAFQSESVLPDVADVVGIRSFQCHDAGFRYGAWVEGAIVWGSLVVSAEEVLERVMKVPGIRKAMAAAAWADTWTEYLHEHAHDD